MDIKAEIMSSVPYLLIPCFFILGADAMGMPIWLAVIATVVLGFAYMAQQDKQEKAQKERDEKLALTMRETEVRMRIEAEQKQAKA